MALAESIDRSQPLVSVITLTYGSSRFVLETLESIKAQTYGNIELIISDDCSKDDTVEKCRNWLEENHKRFARTILMTSEKNTGIPANCNRGVSASLGEWIKLIAGDDILVSDLLTRQMNHIERHSEIEFLWTNVGVFYDTDEGRTISVPEGISELKFNREEITATEQFQLLLRQNPVFTGGQLIKKSVYEKVGMYDESYIYFEDWPFLHKAVLNNIRIHYLDIIGAYYRKHPESVQVNHVSLLRNPYKLDTYRYQITIIQHYTNILERYTRFVFAKYNLFYTSHISNKKTTFHKLFLYLPSMLLQFIIDKLSRGYLSVD